MSDFTLDGHPLGDFNLSARLKDRAADVRLRAVQLGVNADARLSLDPPFHADFEAAIDIPELAVAGYYVEIAILLNVG